MDKEKEKELLERYPDIFQDYHKDITQSCMPWGICCGNGWYDIIDNLCSGVTELSKGKDIQLIADQVKEKFGGLRFYYHIVDKNKPNFESRFWSFIRTRFYSHRLGRQYNFLRKLRMKFYKSTDEKIEELIYEAERKSYETCEICGNKGKTVGGGWVRTLCEKCEKKLVTP